MSGWCGAGGQRCSPLLEEVSLRAGVGHPCGKVGGFPGDHRHAVLATATQQTVGLGREGEGFRSGVEGRERREGASPSHLQETGLTDGVSLRGWP